MIINSLILHQLGTNTFKTNILSPQLEQCAERCDSIDRSNGEANYAPRQEIGAEQGGHVETVANLSKERIYSKVTEFMNDVFETISQNKQAGHSIHIFSPYMDCSVMKQF